MKILTEGQSQRNFVSKINEDYLVWDMQRFNGCIKCPSFDWGWNWNIITDVVYFTLSASINVIYEIDISNF